MKIEKERNSVKITYASEAATETLNRDYELLCQNVGGIYLPSDIQHCKEGIMLSIRHRESLQTYLEKNIFRIDDYISLLREIKTVYTELEAYGWDPGNILWDVDTVFVGNGTDDIEFVYLISISETDSFKNSLTDFLAVVSLHVFDSRDHVIDLLSESVMNFSKGEKEGKKDNEIPELLDRSIGSLSAYSAGSGILRQYYYTLTDKLKRLLPDKGETQAAKNSGTNRNVANISVNRISAAINKLFSGYSRPEKPAAESEDQSEKDDNSTLKIVFKNKRERHRRPAYPVTDKLPRKLHKNGSSGIQSRVEIIREYPTTPAGQHTVYGSIMSPNEYSTALEAKAFGIAPPADDTAVMAPVNSNRRGPEHYLYVNRRLLYELRGTHYDTVSRRHAEILKYGRHYIITDTNSRNGTYLNNERLENGVYYRLKKGDVISLAHKSLSVCFSP